MTFHFPFERFAISLSATLMKIKSFGELPEGWHYGEGVPASSETIARASFVYYFLTQVGFTRTDAFPVEDGSILISAYYRRFYIGVDVEIDGSYSVKEQTDGFDAEYADLQTIQALRSKLLSAAKKVIWTTPASFIHTNSITLGSNSTTQRSKNRRVVAYQ